MKKHTKRYMIIFKTLSGVEDYRLKDEMYKEVSSCSEEEFDDIHDVNNTLKEYAALYSNEVSPVYVNSYYEHRITKVCKCNLDTYYKKDNPDDWKYHKAYWDFSDGKKWWGYLVLDFDECKIINYGGDAQVLFANKRKTGNPWDDRHIKKVNFKSDLRYRDIYFVGDDEIPEGYKWSEGEYEGWLQYRWGDGKNSITYVAPPKQPKKTVIETEEASEEDLMKYVSNYSGPNDDSYDDNDDYNNEYEEYEIYN